MRSKDSGIPRFPSLIYFSKGALVQGGAKLRESFMCVESQLLLLGTERVHPKAITSKQAIGGQPSTIWSAVTCHRFGLRRPDAVIADRLYQRWSRQAATDQSADRSAHSKQLQNNCSNASSTDFTPTTRTPIRRSRPEVFEPGITIFLKPSACASRARTPA